MPQDQFSEYCMSSIKELLSQFESERDEALNEAKALAFKILTLDEADEAKPRLQVEFEQSRYLAIAWGDACDRLQQLEMRLGLQRRFSSPTG